MPLIPRILLLVPLSVRSLARPPAVPHPDALGARLQRPTILGPCLPTTPAARDIIFSRRISSSLRNLGSPSTQIIQIQQDILRERAREQRRDRRPNAEPSGRLPHWRILHRPPGWKHSQPAPIDHFLPHTNPNGRPVPSRGIPILVPLAMRPSRIGRYIISKQLQETVWLAKSVPVLSVM